MPQKIKNIFLKALTFEKMLSAHGRARVNKTNKLEVLLFELNLENNLINLINQIKSNKYHMGKYHYFKVYEPKERIIQALPYIDRIVHQWYVEEFIKPYFVPKFINTSFACLSEKGTHRAVLQVQNYLRSFSRTKNDFWILKCDVSKFFYNINPYILMEILEKSIADKCLLSFTKLLLFQNRTENVGIPIGNYTSQFFANIYLNELDQYIKRTLKIKYYVRYMDDFVLLLGTKEECKLLKEKIETFLWDKLRLKLNNKSKYYPCKMGVNFCGYRIFLTHKLLRTNSKKKIKRKVKYWNKHLKNGTLNTAKTMLQLNSWLGHSSHCDSYKLQKKIINKCDFLFNDRFLSENENYLISLIENENKQEKTSN